MTTTFALVAATIVIACFYDFVNGMNDCANSIATTVSTRALSPRKAILLAALLNMAGAFISTKVAATIGKGVVDPEFAALKASPMLGVVIVLAGVLGAGIWGYICTHWGMPISITHSLVGGLVGAGLVGAGAGCLASAGLIKIFIAMVLSPIFGFIGAFILMAVIYRASFRMHPAKATRVYKSLQVVSAGWMALSHGFNDTQNAMGVITASLLYAKYIDAFAVPWWVILMASAMMGLGTYMGGWKVIKTMGMKIVALTPVSGFAAETAAGTVIAAASQLGAPISTTHVISTAIMGVGATKKLSDVRWNIVATIVATWVFTIPGGAALGALSFFVLKLFFL